MGSLGRLSPGGSIALGIVVGVMSTSVQSLGLTLQRKSHILEDEKDPHIARRPPHRRRRWQLGMAMFIVANLLGSSIQISTLPLPVLSTLQASGLVFNSICATLILGEPFTRWSLYGTLLVCSGAVLIAIFGAIPAPAHDLDELLELLVRPAFVAWMSLQTVVVLSIAVSVEVASALLFTTLAQTSRFRLARGLAYGCISGILSAHSLLVAKSAVELVVRTITDGNNQFRHWQAWALVIALITLALTQLYYLHRGLKLVSTSVLYPLVFCIYNIIAILDGLIYFRQTDMIGPLRACLISLGTVVLLSGVLALSWRLSDEQHPPAVGQSTLAPGLGLVEDTEGEEDEETLLLGRDLVTADDDDVERNTDGNGVGERRSLLRKSKFVSSYQTFGFGTLENDDSPTRPEVESPATHPTSPKLGRRQTAAGIFGGTAGGTTPGLHTPSRWTERAEIWDELEDQNDRRPSSGGSGMKRHRSSTLPVLISEQPPHTPTNTSHSPLSPFSAARRGVSSGSPSFLRSTNSGSAAAGHGREVTDEDADGEALAAYRRSFRRRRKTMGFPGFHARRGSRRSLSGSFSVGAAGGNSSNANTPGTGETRSARGVQNALGGLWRMGWWNSESGGGAGDAARLDRPPTQETVSSPIRPHRRSADDEHGRPSTPPGHTDHGDEQGDADMV
ncbi:uncharacterized protein SPSK_08739 [Sporothrix schenckii 1099-18]|nr:uncharacterized protein SPSK_08739 [Sporothrix schenckii 1099-18]KJR85231.1 hypothetical protein SPSK_08739 [Sporothrix schenckii 1099-18]